MRSATRTATVYWALTWHWAKCFSAMTSSSLSSVLTPSLPPTWRDQDLERLNLTSPQGPTASKWQGLGWALCVSDSRAWSCWNLPLAPANPLTWAGETEGCGLPAESGQQGASLGGGRAFIGSFLLSPWGQGNPFTPGHSPVRLPLCMVPSGSQVWNCCLPCSLWFP